MASLIDDVRFQTSRKLKAKLLSYYIENNKNKINKIEFVNDFYILSVLRNLKIIGIFTRLSLRDQKNQYLKLIPYLGLLATYLFVPALEVPLLTGVYCSPLLGENK